MKKIAFVQNGELYKRLNLFYNNHFDINYLETIHDIKYSDKSFDLVVYNIEDYSGIETLKSEYRDYLGLSYTPVIFIVDTFRNGSFGLRNALDDYIFKPFEPELLLNRILIKLEFKELSDKLRDIISQQAAIQDLSEVLTSGFSYKKRLRLVVEKLSATFGVENLSIIFIDESDPLKGKVVMDLESDLDLFQEIELDLNKYPEIRESIKTKKPFYVENIYQYEKLKNFIPNLVERNIYSILIIPIIYIDEILGVISIKFPLSNSEIYQRLINYSLIIANTTAIAIKNATTLEQLRKQTEITTSYKVKQEEFINSMKHYYFLIDKASIPVILIDKTGFIHLINRYCERYFNYDKFKFLRLNFWELIKTELDRDLMLSKMKSITKDDFHQSCQITLSFPEGIERSVLLHITAIQKNVYMIHIDISN
ncbi:hypothetical protein JXR93_13170 [bacterium]|nr:hypothetical protein [bacterium]